MHVNRDDLVGQANSDSGEGRREVLSRLEGMGTSGQMDSFDIRKKHGQFIHFSRRCRCKQVGKSGIGGLWNFSYITSVFTVK